MADGWVYVVTNRAVIIAENIPIFVPAFAGTSGNANFTPYHLNRSHFMKKNLLFAGLLGASVAVAGFVKPSPWTTLFDGKSTKGWHSYNKTGVQGWTIDNGTLTTDGKAGDLVTDKEYENFELEFDFKVQPKGNSGVIYKVIESKDLNQPYISGPEYQVIDDKGYVWVENGQQKQLSTKQLTGASYDVLAPNDLSVVKPAGEWNKGRIVVNNDHVQHFLNGKKVVEYHYGGEEWKKLVAGSKFAKWKYAEPHAKGRIALQGHGDTVWYRNIRIREL